MDNVSTTIKNKLRMSNIENKINNYKKSTSGFVTKCIDKTDIGKIENVKKYIKEEIKRREDIITPMENVQIYSGYTNSVYRIYNSVYNKKIHC